MVETLKEIVKKNILDVGEGLPAVVNNMDLLLRATPYECEVEEVDKGINRLAEEYFRLSIGGRYDLLSRDLFGLKREVNIPESSVEIIKRHEQYKTVKFKEIDSVEIPLFAVVKYGESSWSHKGKVSGILSLTDRYGSESSEASSEEFNVGTKSPLLPQKVKQKAGEAMAFAYETCANTLKDPIMRRYLSTVDDLRTPEDITELVKPGLFVLWKPRLEDLEVKVEVQEPVDKDPALLLSFNRDVYLVTLWDVENEDPLEHYIHEFKESRRKK